MKKIIGIFIENYIAGGCDKIARDLIDGLDYKKLYIFVNKDSDLKILMNKELPLNVKLITYKIPSIVKMGSFANTLKSKSIILYVFFKVLNLILRYPLMLFSFIYFIKLFYSYKIDLFFSNNGGYPGGEFNRMASLAYSFIGKKNYHIVHNLATKPFFKLFTPIEKLIDYSLEKRCDFICVSNQTKEYLLKNRNIKKQPIVIYNGVDEYTNSSVKKFNKKIKLLNIGLLGNRKNQVLIIEALKVLKDKGYSDVELHIIGEEEDIGYKDILINKIEKYKLSNIFFEGFCNPYDYYESCDIFVLSSIVESFALVRVEAMSVGMPIITTDVGDAFMQVENDKNGFIIKDAEELAEALEKYIISGELIEKHSKKSIETYRTKFTKDKMITSYKELIERD